MAKKMRRLLALVIALALTAGQVVVPAMATETGETPAQTVEVTVDVAQAIEEAPAPVVETPAEAPVPEAPAAQPQAPAPTPEVSVTTEAPATTTNHDTASGVIEQSTSTTTNWSGTEGGSTTTGSETVTTTTGTDDYTGDKLYEGGSIEGTETTTSTETSSESVTEEGTVTKEVTLTVEGEGDLGGETKTTTSEETSDVTEEGDWASGEIVEGEFEKTSSEDWEETDTTVLGEEVLPEGGVTITLTPDTTTQNPNDFSGTANGEVIPLTEGVTIPEGAVLVKDDDGNVIGYKRETTTETITDTTVNEGEAKKDEANSVTDTTADTAVVTPDLETAKQNLGVRIDDNSKIDEETDADGNVTAYVVTNTSVEESPAGDFDEYTTRPEAGEFVQRDGSVITRTVEDVTDADGNVIGFKSTTVQTKDGVELTRNETTQIIIESELPEAAAPVTTFTLPEKPAESTKTENGVTTTVTVTEIKDDAGNVIGYKSTTVQTDASGAELYREEADIYGTTETTTESISSGNPAVEVTGTLKTTIVETTRVTAEESTYEDIAAYKRLNQIVNEMTVDKTSEVVMIDGKLYYIYSGSMTVSEGEGHGDTTMMEPLDIMESLFTANRDLDLDWGGNDLDNTRKPDEGFKYVGYGIDTALNISKGNESSDVVQFRLKGANGKEYYAMCIDFNTTIKEGHLYDIADLSSEDYYQKDGSLSVSSAEKIRIIALNGYWGTADDTTSTNDIGSLDEVKNLVSAYLTAQGTLTADEITAIVNSLTPGQAQAATQAALWKYGNIDGTKTVNENNLVPGESRWVEVEGTGGRGQRPEYEQIKSEDYLNTEYVYKALLDLANDEDTKLAADEGVEFLDAEDITGGSITVKSKVISEDEAHANNDDNPNNDVYNTDIGFTLGIEPAKLGGDLIVTVTVGDKVSKYRLAGEDVEFSLLRITADENGVYTIPNVEIAEGVTVNLNLSGTQDLGTGVYIYTSLNDTRTDSQTLVTLATGSRKVNLDMNMSLSVEEPTVTREASGTTEYGTRTDTQEQTKTDTVERTSTTTKSELDRTRKSESEYNKVYTADVTLTRVTTKQTKEAKSWISSWLKFFAPDPVPFQDDFGGGDDGGEDGEGGNGGNGGEVTLVRRNGKLTTILDEDVPLANAPKTGDISLLWAAISALSLGGMAALSIKRKEEE